MDKDKIKTYAIEARNELIDQIKQRAYQYGIREDGYEDEDATIITGQVLSPEEVKQRKEFIGKIKESNYQQAIEEVAYTWFNRFIALRFMEVNDYLPTHTRVFSDANGQFNPQILTDVLHLDLEGLDIDKVSDLLNNNQTEELYRYLLLTQCNALNDALPEMFEKLGSYTEMLLPNNILKEDGILGKLVTDIPEEDWLDAVQIIGWMYQYYNTEPKETVFAGLKKNKKITKDKIPAATQLFTPDWIVRYMVENSLGRLWIESHPNDALKANWEYYLDEAEQTPEVTQKLIELRSQSPIQSPEDIRFIDPCMGSGHILVYAFDVLMQIYESEGYKPRDAVRLILEKNLHGLDIDKRAYQLSYFALMMKARQYDRRILRDDIRPQIYHPIGWDEGEEYGSLIKIDKLEPKPETSPDQVVLGDDYEQTVRIWDFKRLLSQQYDVVVTNPPYMGSGGMNTLLSQHVKEHYPDSKHDLFATFIERGIELLKLTGYLGIITQHSWMFLTSYERFRAKLLSFDIISMAHLGTRAFDEIGGEVVQATTCIFSKSQVQGFEGLYVRLVDYGSQKAKEDVYLSGDKQFKASTQNFTKIPGSPVAYWMSQQVEQAFKQGIPLHRIAEPKQGIATAHNDRFLRLWHEVSNNKLGLNYDSREEAQYSTLKWFPYNKGGEFRKWYGNNDFIVNWEHDGIEIRNFFTAEGRLASRPQNLEYIFKESVTWSKISSGDMAFRYKPVGHLFDVAGTSIFGKNNSLHYIHGFCNSVVALAVAEILSPTLNYEVGHIANFPIIFGQEDLVEEIVLGNISLSRTDWDSFETSWDFVRHPLISGDSTVEAAFNRWQDEAEDRFQTLKTNEEELNRIFIGIYGLEDELTPEVEDNKVTVRRADLGRDIRSFISYAVGCMFGRYSLDVEGLAYAGGEWDPSKYSTYLPDADNILPITDDHYFDDDIVGRFVEFVRAVYGDDTLEENLAFIADALGRRGTPREVIREYFLKDFYKDHCQIYRKRPIYWQFESGKKNGFKALIYLHRYSHDLLARLRTDYIHEQQERYRTQLNHIAHDLETTTGGDRTRLSKQQAMFIEQLEEISVFEEKVHHLADQQIELDLDDGVKVNYTKFPGILSKI